MTRRAVVVSVLLLLLVACGGDPDALEPTAAATDPELTAAVATTFATYRAGIEAGDAGAVTSSLTAASLMQMREEVPELARTASADTTRELPAALQILVLTYRLEPELLDAEAPYAALIEAGLAGQDRTLGELGTISAASDDLALAVIVSPSTGQPTPLRWRFSLEDGEWRFDLVEAHRLLSQAIASSATRTDTEPSDVVIGTLVQLSGSTVEEIVALYEPPGPSTRDQ